MSMQTYADKEVQKYKDIVAGVRGRELQAAEDGKLFRQGFMDTLVNKSKSGAFTEAIHEWYEDRFFIGEGSKCICHAHPIKLNCVLKNRFNKHVLTIGSTCLFHFRGVVLKRFLDEAREKCKTLGEKKTFEKVYERYQRWGTPYLFYPERHILEEIVGRLYPVGYTYTAVQGSVREGEVYKVPREPRRKKKKEATT